MGKITILCNFLRIDFSIQVDSVNKHGILLKVVQVLTDMNLVITKAYISSDGDWFMDGKVSSAISQKVTRFKRVLFCL